MENTINGIHHITAIAGNAKRNYDFYTKVLGQRIVKKTVNFDDPETYHLYYGDKQGTPGTILTFFPWEGIGTGRRGPRQATEIGYSVPQGSLDFWLKRFEKYNVTYIPKDFNLDNPAFSFAIKYSKQGNKIIAMQEFRNNYLLMQPKDFPDWNSAIKKINNQYKEQVVLEARK